jgi:hypothetical protein
MKLLPTAVAAIMLVASTANAQSPVAAGTTAAALTQLRAGVDGIMNDAMQNADLMKFRLGVEMREMIDKWEAANASTLDKAFSGLNNQQKTFFTNSQSQIDQAKQVASGSLTQIEDISRQVNQTTSTITFLGDKKARIIKVRPMVLAPGGSGYRDIIVTGLSLDDANPQLTIKGFPGQVQRVELLQTSAKFRIRPSDYAGPDGGLTSLAGKIEYIEKPSAWFKKRVARDVSFWALPPVLAHYTAIPTVEQINRITDTVEVDAGEAKGRNKNIYLGVKPPSGWKIDLARTSEFGVRGAGGEAGRCQAVDEAKRSEEGVEVRTRVDEIKKISISGVQYKDGHIRCIAILPVYKTETTKVAAAPIVGDLKWNEAVRIEPPAGLTGWAISFDVIDGRKVQLLGSGSDRYFEVQSFGQELIIKPSIPADI